ncbi:formate--tetrahydrofolate ligase [Ureaplasma ceti]
MKRNIIQEVMLNNQLAITDFENYTSEIAKVTQIEPTGKKAKLVLVTSMNPTPVGEGKTTTSIGIVDSLNSLGVKTVGCLREPSMGPVFGMKGTGSGSNNAKLLPFDKINLHFTGDLHAITSANNLISAVIENEIYQNSDLDIDPNRILWQRCEDMNDRSLRDTSVNLFNKNKDRVNTCFNITAASDLMALFCLAKSKEDFRQRINDAIVAYSRSGQPIRVSDLEITEAIMTIISDALDPNLVRTMEDRPVFVHGGPFANIAHGCSSVIATNYGLDLADVVITEAGFGSELGMEKFMDITCQQAGWTPNLIVLVVSLKSILHHAKDTGLTGFDAVKYGFDNVKHHINHCKQYGLNLVIAINHRSEDDLDQLKYLYKLLDDEHVAYALADTWAYGSKGGQELAKVILQEINKPVNFTPLYAKEDNLFDKINKICQKAYGSLGPKYSALAQSKLEEYQNLDGYYVCIAKNPYSLTCDQKILGRPTNFYTTIEDVEINHAAKLIIPITTVVFRMPGLPKVPAAKNFVMK